MADCSTKDCPLVPRVEALEKTNEQHSATHREIFKRMGDVEQDNAVTEVHYKNIMDNIATIKTSITALETRSSALEQKPAKRWDGMVDKLIWGVIGVLAGAAGSALLQLLKMGIGA